MVMDSSSLVALEVLAFGTWLGLPKAGGENSQWRKGTAVNDRPQVSLPSRASTNCAAVQSDLPVNFSSSFSAAIVTVTQTVWLIHQHRKVTEHPAI